MAEKTKFVLNFVTKILDDSKTKALVKIDENGDYVFDENDSPISIFDNECRNIAFFISHRRDLVSLGYINQELVWFSLTKTDDLLHTRRIFDSMKVAVFYRSTDLDTALSMAGMVPRDLETMVPFMVSDVQNEEFMFSTTSKNTMMTMTGDEFSAYIQRLPYRLQENITKVYGDTDDLLLKLKVDFEKLQLLYEPGEAFDIKKYRQAAPICESWRKCAFIGMSERPTVRALYSKVCRHKAGVFDVPIESVSMT